MTIVNRRHPMTHGATRTGVHRHTVTVESAPPLHAIALRWALVLVGACGNSCTVILGDVAPGPDAGAMVDQATADAGHIDRDGADGGLSDAGAPDAGAIDAGPSDAGAGDAGVVEPDAGVMVSIPDAGPSVPPVGSLDLANDAVAAGWARDPDWAGPIDVHIYFDDELVDILTAGLPRGDVGNHAFHQPHESFGSGVHTVKAFAIGVDSLGRPDGMNPLIGGPLAVAPACNNLPAISRGWCTAVPHYWRDKFKNTTRLLSKNLIAGINRSYGGAIFELFGHDRSWNLINEQGGAAVQISVWGYGANQEQRGTALPGKGMPCPGALPNADPLGWPYNPIQAQQRNCSWAESEGASNDVDGWNIGPGTITTQLNDPINYTGSLPMVGMQFQQVATLENDAYLSVNYHVVNFSPVPIKDPHPQEVPAIFLNTGPAPVVTYFQGASPWSNAAVTTRSLAVDTSLTLGLLGRDIAAPANGGQIDEGWYSVCSADSVHCVTIATPVVGASTVWEAQISANPATGNTYATLMSYYAISSNSAHDTTVWLFPFRYDEVVSGKTVRSWICQLNGRAC